MNIRTPSHVRRGPGHQVAGALVVVEAEAQALQSLVEGVADVVGDALAQRFAKILLPVGGHAPQGAYHQDQHGQVDEGRDFAGLNHLVNGGAEYAGYGQGKGRYADGADVGKQQSVLVLQGEADEPEQDAHCCMTTFTKGFTAYGSKGEERSNTMPSVYYSKPELASRVRV